MKMWMIRHPNMTFARPMSEPELVAKIEAGEVTAQDEIATHAGYWFTIQEVEEVKNFFGENIRLQALMPSGSDTTSATNTAAIVTNKTLNPKVVPPATQTQPAKSSHPEQQQSKMSTSHAQAMTYSKMDDLDAPVAGASRLVFGLFLIAIFLGTLYLLWMGSR